jgi:putative MATE family efflux protein
MSAPQAVRADSFYTTMLRLAVPISAQALVTNLLNAVDGLMVGQLGETTVAAVGLANQVAFVQQIFLFGVGSGSAIFTAQYWGMGDVPSIRRMVGLALTIALAGSAVFTGVALLAPQAVLSLYTSDPAVIRQGAAYLRVAGLSYLPLAITAVYGMIHRSTRHVKVPLVVTVSALSLKTVLAYLLVFGVLGLPSMGAQGAAAATVIARALEVVAMLALTYGLDLPAAARLREMLDLSRDLIVRFALTTWPVIVGEILWSLGITTLIGIYARVGTDAVASYNIAGTIESVAWVPFIGIANACAIMVGNAIGAGAVDEAQDYARRFRRISIGGGAIVGLGLAVASGSIVGLYRISPEAQVLTRNVMLVLGAALWLKATNLTVIVGILRAGGDTKWALVADTAPLWFIGIPMALVGAFVLYLPIYWVVVMSLADELTKFALCAYRTASTRWIHNVARA